MARGTLQSGDLGGQHAVVRYIMVVDDDDSARETKSILEQAGFDARVLKDGGQVHGSLSMDRPDVVLLQLILPGESGFEICERLKVGSMLFRLVGQNRDVNSTTFYNPKQAKPQEKADRKGVALFLSDKPTAEEAADVIQAH